MLNSSKKAKRGVTLVELTIVMALIAVISVSVVSFCTAFNTRIVLNTQYKESINAASSTKDLIIAWFSYYDNENYTLSFSSGNIYATNVKTQKKYSIILKDDCVIGQYPDGKNGFYSSEKIKGISFYRYAFKNQDNECLWRCTISYSLQLRTTGNYYTTEKLTFLLKTRSDNAN